MGQQFSGQSMHRRPQEQRTALLQTRIDAAYAARLLCAQQAGPTKPPPKEQRRALARQAGRARPTCAAEPERHLLAGAGGSGRSRAAATKLHLHLCLRQPVEHLVVVQVLLQGRQGGGAGQGGGDTHRAHTPGRQAHENVGADGLRGWRVQSAGSALGWVPRAPASQRQADRQAGRGAGRQPAGAPYRGLTPQAPLR